VTAPAAAPLTDKLPATIGGPALRAAALAGDAAAEYEVGVRFADGRGVAQNGEEAARWLDRAAKGGFAPAMFRRGALYEKGAGVKKDLAAARDHYRAAARSAIEQWTPLPQPADEAPKGAWDAPASPAPTAKSKPRNAKASVPEAAKLN
jgi:TPR repeat protein